MQILHVDDDENTRELVALSLNLFGGHQVTSCESGACALDQLLCLHPDLILLDLMMPEMDGEELLTHLLGLDAVKNIPIIFLTGNTRKSTRLRLLEYGALSLIPKPFDPVTLSSKILEVLEP